MEHKQGKYALVQYCPVPERLEVLNIGLVLVVPDENFVGVRFARGQGRIDRAFGRQPKFYLDALKSSFCVRLKSELADQSWGEGFEKFVDKRANEVRVSRLMSIMISDTKRDFARLFDELVGEDDPASREPRIRHKLREAFISNHVEHYLDNPGDVSLPEFGLKINVPYGYQNGCYNFIDGMRVPANSADGLREAGKRAMEGGLIWKHFENGPRKRLVVVGDFSQQSNGFYHAVESQFAKANVKLHRLDNMRALLKDIKEHAD